MNRRFNSYQRPAPRRLAGLTTAPTIPAEWMNPPSPMPQPNHCGMSEETAQCVVDQLRPLNFTRAENIWLALIAGGLLGFWAGREWR